MKAKRIHVLHAAVAGTSTFLIASGAAGIIRLDTKSDADYLAYGAGFPMVARMDANPSINDFRSCVLINDQWILTGGHNYANNGFKMKIQLGGEQYEATNWYRHPRYNSGALESGYDFAVGQLDRRCLNVLPANFYAGQSEAGLVGSYVGFGATGNGIAGQTGNDFKKRAGTNLLEFWSDYPNIIWADFDNGTTANNTLTSALSANSSPQPTTLECNLGNGDSGGGVFVWVGGQWQLVGISSFRARLDSGSNSAIYGSVIAASRINRALPWILETATSPGKISGQVALNDWGAAALGQSVQAQLINPATGAVIEDKSIPLDLKGGYSFSTAYRGVADLFVKGAHWLRGKIRLNITAAGCPSTNFSLRNGDADGDNVVSVFDAILVNDNFDMVPGDPGYDPRTDLDGDGGTTLFDYLLVSNNFDQQGD